MHLCAALLIVTLSPLVQQDAEPVLEVNMLRNGDFAIPIDPKGQPRGIPWWTQRGAPLRIQSIEERPWLVTEKSGVAIQAVPAFAPLAGDLVVTGRHWGRGVITIIDGQGRHASLVHGQAGELTEFEWSGAEITAELGAAPMPRLVLELKAAEGGVSAWTDLEVRVPLPCPDEEALRAEVVERLHEVLDPWIERGLDRFGERETGFVAAYFDAVTGERITTHSAGYHPLGGLLLDVAELEPVPTWQAARDGYLEALLNLGLHPETGLPCMWDPIADKILDQRFVNVHAALEFLINTSERGPEEYRERARLAAIKLADTVIERGVLPDGNVAPLYRPADGQSSNEARPIRRLDVPAQLTRIGALEGDPRHVEVARIAVATIFYTHYWPGSWDRIDPAFDDYFGHYAARAVTMLEDYPDEPLFRRVVDGGFAHLGPLWRKALRFGGSMAADQVRCWETLIDYSAIQPALREPLDELLEEAIHSHLKGEQYGNGAWGDVTYKGFQPKVDLQVGDFPGAPANLLRGLALVYESGMGPDDDETRAFFTAVLRSTVTAYRRPFGYLLTMREIDGANNAGGSLRIAPALALMLEKLSAPR